MKHGTLRNLLMRYGAQIGLRGNEMQLLWHILDFDFRDTGMSYPPEWKLAERMGFKDERGVRKILKSINEKGLIEISVKIVPGDKRKNVYRWRKLKKALLPFWQQEVDQTKKDVSEPENTGTNDPVDTGSKVPTSCDTGSKVPVDIGSKVPVDTGSKVPVKLYKESSANKAREGGGAPRAPAPAVDVRRIWNFWIEERLEAGKTTTVNPSGREEEALRSLLAMTSGDSQRIRDGMRAYLARNDMGLAANGWPLYWLPDRFNSLGNETARDDGPGEWSK